MSVKPKRPDGLTAIAILWFIGGLISSLLLIIGAEMLTSLSNPLLNPVLILVIVSFMLGIARIIAVYGLWTGKRYSYKLALVIPIANLSIDFLTIGLYASVLYSSRILSSLVSGVFWIVIIWWYLGKPHVKAFLGVIPASEQQTVVV